MQNSQSYTCGVLHGHTQDACAVSFSITHVNQMHTELCTCAFSTRADLILTVLHSWSKWRVR